MKSTSLVLKMKMKIEVKNKRNNYNILLINNPQIPLLWKMKKFFNKMYRNLQIYL